MRSLFKKLGALAATTAFIAPGFVQAAPPGIDPHYQIANQYAQDPIVAEVDDVDDIYMNRNQLALRLTGKHYDAHITNGQSHWEGSGLGLMEDIFNGLIIGASFTSGATSTNDMFRNFLDLIIRRFLTDGNPLTPIDYDTQTFFMVDAEHPAGRLPNAPNTATLTDINADGIEGGWEPVAALLDRLCLPSIPGFGDMCLHMNLVNVSGTPKLTSTPLNTAISNTYDVNDAARPALRFATYNVGSPLDGSHILLASQPNNTFDNELDTCDEPEFSDPGGNCDEATYRDDDDGLFFQFQLADFEADLLFEPPFTTDATATTVGQEGCQTNSSTTPLCGLAAVTATVDDWWDNDADADVSDTTSGLPAGWAVNITDMTDGDTFTTDIGGNNYETGFRNETGAVEGGVTGPRPIPGCPLLRGGDDYDSACDLSNYLKIHGYINMPQLLLSASVRIVGTYIDATPDLPTGPTATTDAINFGVVLQSLSASLDFILTLDAGPYCENDFDFADGSAVGMDAAGVYLGATDNPNNCVTPVDNDGVANISDDSTYLKSEKFAAVLSYVRSEIAIAMDDFFAAGTNPEYFMGPTGIDIMSFLGGDTIGTDWFTDPDTDHLFFLISLDSSVDATQTTDNLSEYRTIAASTWVGDTRAEFFADDHGVLMPFSGGLAFDWYADTDATPHASCVQDEAAFTGYLDGYGSDVTDNPTVSRPLPRLKTEWPGTENIAGGALVENATEDMGSALLQRKIPNMNGVGPYDLPTHAVPFSTDTTDGAYGIGIALHQNFLSKAIYELVVDGLLCVEFGVSDKDDALFDTSLLQFFVPYLYDNFPDMPVGIRLVPYLADPNNEYWPLGAGDGPNFPSAISEAIATDGGAYPVETTISNPVPRVIMGGVNTYNQLKERYAGEITTQYLGPVWPDFSIVVPHMAVEFYVWDTSGGSDVLKRAFALDVGLNVGLNIDITQDPGAPASDTFGNSTFMDSIADTDIATALARPAYTGTDFPIGCGSNTAYPCEITGVPSRVVVSLAGILDPELNAVLVYDEMASSQTTQDTFLSGGSQDTSLAIFEDSISNLIGLALSSEIDLFAEIGLDPAAYLDIPVVLNFPYIGPSFVYRDDAATVAIEDLGCGDVNAGGICDDPLGFATTVDRDVSDNDTNGFGDYLIAAFSVDVTWIESDYLFRLIDSFVEPIAYDCDTLDCQSENYQLGSFLDDILGAPAAPSGDIRLPRGYVSPETYIKGVRKAHATETLIDFEGFHPTEGADTLTYAWRVDGGLWSPFNNFKNIRIPGLLEGRHVFEVKGKDSKGNVEWTPSRIEFVVDSVGPKSTIVGDRVQSTDARFFVDVRDSQTLPEDIRVAYSIDGSEWTRYSYNKDIALTAAPGRHTMNVRAVDEAGNVTLSSLNFSVEEGGFGCSVAAGTSSSADASMLLLLLPAIVIAVRRRRS